MQSLCCIYVVIFPAYVYKKVINTSNFKSLSCWQITCLSWSKSRNQANNSLAIKWILFVVEISLAPCRICIQEGDGHCITYAGPIILVYSTFEHQIRTESRNQTNFQTHIGNQVMVYHHVGTTILIVCHHVFI